MRKLIAVSPILILCFTTWLTLTNRWIVPSVNEWQADVMGDNKYFPALTGFILALPLLLVVLLIKKQTGKKSS
jgi:hypothetical protein